MGLPKLITKVLLKLITGTNQDDNGGLTEFVMGGSSLSQSVVTQVDY